MLYVKIFGACGYGGVGIIELLLRHPESKIVKLIDIENIGVPISNVYPHLTGFCDLNINAPETDAPEDVFANSLFFATPDGVGMQWASRYLEKGYKIVDYSGDFRFNSESDYAQYAEKIGRPPIHAVPELLKGTVYGLTELNRADISSTNLVGNPGCFAIATILAFAPLIKAKAIDCSQLICDAKTGVSGAGKKPSASFHYPARYENMNPYKIGIHQHIIEIEKQLSILAECECRITLNTQVVPLARGIMVSAYGHLDEHWDMQRVYELYKNFYDNESFIRVLPTNKVPCSMDVRGSNFCLLSVFVDSRTGICLIVGQIDNLVKGQAGSALQNMNLMHGLDETLGIYHPSMVP